VPRRPRALATFASLAAVLAVGLAVSTGADAKRRTDCERAGSRTRIETGQLRVYDVVVRARRKPTSTSTYACRKGSTRPPILLLDDRGNDDTGIDNLVVLFDRLTLTSVRCAPGVLSCTQRVRLLDLGDRHSRYGEAAPAGGDPAVWQAVRALPSLSGAMVYSAQTPVEPTPDRPLVDARIAVVGADGVTHELDRGPGVEADTLAVAQLADNLSLFTWRSGGVLRAATY
jgi:hypothetical protein